jgi:hypothetical protein
VSRLDFALLLAIFLFIALAVVDLMPNVKLDTGPLFPAVARHPHR